MSPNTYACKPVMPSSTKIQVPKISEAEWTVMRVFWKLGDATTGEVIAELEGKTEWKPKTIQTLIGRLVKKGALTFQKRGRDHLYRAAIDEKTCEHEASRSFLDRVYEGKLAPFLATFVERGDYSPEELAELKRILNEETTPNGSPN